MERVTGIGGVFFKARDPAGLRRWYQEHLGTEPETDGDAVVFPWRLADHPETTGSTTWSIFSHDTTYFDPTTADHMINYRVSNLDRMLEQLRAAGVRVDDAIHDSEFGRFGWAIDAEGNRFELWEPAEGL